MCSSNALFLAQRCRTNEAVAVMIKHLEVLNELLPDVGDLHLAGHLASINQSLAELGGHGLSQWHAALGLIAGIANHNRSGWRHG